MRACPARTEDKGHEAVVAAVATAVALRGLPLPGRGRGAVGRVTA